MANSDVRSGLVPRFKHGAPYVGGGIAMHIASGDSTALFVGDPVVTSGTSNTAEVKVVGGTFAPGTLQTVTKATAGAGNLIDGVIVGFLPTDRDSGTYSPASTEGVAIVETDPFVIYEIQEDGAGATIAATDIGLNADLVFTHSGSTVYGTSGAELDISSKATTANLQLKIMGLVNRGDNELAANAKVLVSINQHRFKDSAGVAGV